MGGPRTQGPRAYHRPQPHPLTTDGFPFTGPRSPTRVRALAVARREGLDGGSRVGDGLGGRESHGRGVDLGPPSTRRQRVSARGEEVVAAQGWDLSGSEWGVLVR